jgi:hypothetical protein
MPGPIFANGNVEIMLGQWHRDDDHPLIGCSSVVSANTLQECGCQLKATGFLSVPKMINELGEGEHDIGYFAVRKPLAATIESGRIT